jgi:3-dehydrotetronate 4-kinase
MLLGCIADDFTGATDLALMLQRGGMQTFLVIGAPQSSVLPEADAIVVALKTRTCPVKEAVSLSLKSVEALLAGGARQIMFKYCSTFDSTDSGNIGPVIDALMQRVNAKTTIACPAFPANGRTVYQGHLFVGDQLLSESSMRDHPLTPMHDANLVRVLQRQTKTKVSLLPARTIDKGLAAVRAAIDLAASRGEIMICDAVTENHLMILGRACADLPLITGGSGIAMGLPDNFRKSGLLGSFAHVPFVRPKGRAAILAGSCSTATRGQIKHAIAKGIPALRLRPEMIVDGNQSTDSAVRWATEQNAKRPILIYSSAEATDVLEAQAKLGAERAAATLESTLASIASSLVASGFTQLLVAGGETSGAVVNALGLRVLTIGPEIDPGVPWTRSINGPELAVALKSGNFGAEDFFVKAWEIDT